VAIEWLLSGYWVATGWHIGSDRRTQDESEIIVDEGTAYYIAESIDL